VIGVAPGANDYPGYETAQTHLQLAVEGHHEGTEADLKIQGLLPESTKELSEYWLRGYSCRKTINASGIRTERMVPESLWLNNLSQHERDRITEEQQQWVDHYEARLQTEARDRL
jgi:hypothetical protein